MKILLIIIIAFLVLIYAYTFIKYKKRKQNQINTVETYRKNYLERINAKSSPKYDEYKDYDIRRHITKYNSSLDYVEWNDFLDDINKQKHDENSKKIKPKRLQY